ncbi:hypothetical protein [Bacillus testis]|uniref:hypothetical protein n=1 Tax=Bacillus testis TaxID=1622072 RepID=UPI00067F2B34|nr:hypothetical protein [Bacillus testis]
MANKTQKEVENEFLSEREAILKQPKTKLFIQPDRINRATHQEVIINGQKWVLAVGKQLEVPQVVADVYNESVAKTLQAEYDMDKFDEIK